MKKLGLVVLVALFAIGVLTMVTAEQATTQKVCFASLVIPNEGIKKQLDPTTGGLEWPVSVAGKVVTLVPDGGCPPPVLNEDLWYIMSHSNGNQWDLVWMTSGGSGVIVAEKLVHDLSQIRKLPVISTKESWRCQTPPEGVGDVPTFADPQDAIAWLKAHKLCGIAYNEVEGKLCVVHPTREPLPLWKWPVQGRVTFEGTSYPMAVFKTGYRMRVAGSDTPCGAGALSVYIAPNSDPNKPKVRPRHEWLGPIDERRRMIVPWR